MALDVHILNALFDFLIVEQVARHLRQIIGLDIFGDRLLESIDAVCREYGNAYAGNGRQDDKPGHGVANSSIRRADARLTER